MFCFEVFLAKQQRATDRIVTKGPRSVCHWNYSLTKATAREWERETDSLKITIRVLEPQTDFDDKATLSLLSKTSCPIIGEKQLPMNFNVEFG